MSASSGRVKRSLPTIAARNRVFGNILRALAEKESFLLLGHVKPDEDCLGALVAFALLAWKLQKRATICLRRPFPPQFRYLEEICSFNGIRVAADGKPPEERYDAVVVLDTPKPSMIDVDETFRPRLADPKLLRIEIDHHLETDAEHFGDEDYGLVSDASSSCELVGFLAFKLDSDAALKERFGVSEVFSRNLVLAVITGVIGDSRMGKYLKTARERRLYRWVSELFDRMLAEKTHGDPRKLNSKESVFQAIASLTDDEERCYERLLSRKTRAGRFDLVVVEEGEAAELRNTYGEETFVAAVKAAADALAESSGSFGFIAYPEEELAQFRIRRARAYSGFDLRDLLTRLSLLDGGGHPGAVGFRLPKREVPDLQAFCAEIAVQAEALIPD